MAKLFHSETGILRWADKLGLDMVGLPAARVAAVNVPVISGWKWESRGGASYASTAVLLRNPPRDSGHVDAEKARDQAVWVRRGDAAVVVVTFPPDAASWEAE